MKATITKVTDETYKNLRFRLEDTDTATCYAKAWRGKAKHPYAYFQFRTLEKRTEWLAEQRQFADDEEARKIKATADRKANRAELLANLQPGAILVNTWGWEQTNVDFYEVVGRAGASVTVRAINKRPVTATGPMAAMVKAVPGSFYGEPIVKKIAVNGVQFNHGNTTLTDAQKEHYCSWYA